MTHLASNDKRHLALASFCDFLTFVSREFAAIQIRFGISVSWSVLAVVGHDHHTCVPFLRWSTKTASLGLDFGWATKDGSKMVNFVERGRYEGERDVAIVSDSCCVVK